jgi:hypothetical protein
MPVAKTKAKAACSGAAGPRSMTEVSGVSEEAVRAATGRGWSAWLAALKKAGARAWTHKEIVAWLAACSEMSGWWRQTVAVAFEKAVGLRVVGQTGGAGFQVGVARTIAAPIGKVWEALV